MSDAIKGFFAKYYATPIVHRRGTGFASMNDAGLADWLAHYERMSQTGTNPAGQRLSDADLATIRRELAGMKAEAERRLSAAATK